MVWNYHQNLQRTNPIVLLPASTTQILKFRSMLNFYLMNCYHPSFSTTQLVYVPRMDSSRGLVMFSVTSLTDGFISWFSRWWFQIFVIFTPTWGNDPIWLYNIFQMGWNHHLDILCVVFYAFFCVCCFFSQRSNLEHKTLPTFKGILATPPKLPPQ